MNDIEDYNKYILLLNNFNDEFEKAVKERNKVKIEDIETQLVELENTIPYNDLKCYLYFVMASIYDFYSKFENNYEHKGYDLISNYNRKELSYFRKAIYSEGFKDLQNTQKDLKIKLLTNYANLLNFLGRSLEAIEIWSICIKESPNFGMAYANYSIALQYILVAIYDENHKDYFYSKMIVLNNKAIKGYLEPEARSNILKKLKNVDLSYHIERLKYLNKSNKLGNSRLEQKYRKWVLINKLFLNPLNIISKKPIVAQDVFHLPNLTENKNQNKFNFYQLYNKLKQEFVSARYMFFEATIIEKGKTHFSDKDVLLQSPIGNECIHSLSIEKLTFCYRGLFSIFDKVAFFLNRYLNLSHKNKLSRFEYHFLREVLLM